MLRLSTALLLAATCLLLTADFSAAGAHLPCNYRYTNFAHAEACEGFDVTLSCPGGIIWVHSANYGRTDQMTCSAGRPNNQIQNTACDNPTSIVGDRCNGESTCTVSATNTVFGDPCVGTYKYLRVVYSCRKHVVECEHDSATLSCDNGQVIWVHSANYGRTDQTTCIAGRPSSQYQNTACDNPTSIVADRCNGESSCTVTATNSVFGDPCVGTFKYLDVVYSCTIAHVGCDHPFSNIHCAHAVGYMNSGVRLMCGPNEIISVYDTFTDGRSLTHYNPHDSIAQRCNGQNTCMVNPNVPYGSTCTTYYMYLQVAYSCHKHSVTCEHDSATLTCDDGKVIWVLSANYGRTDQTTCIAGRPSSQYQNTGCDNPTSIVGDSCNGQTTCTIAATNSVFGDPCVGTFKYLDVVYTCKTAPPAAPPVAP